MSSIIYRLFAAACAAVSATALPAAPPAPPPVASQSSVRPDALELARVLNPAEPMIQLAARSFDEAFQQSMAEDGGTEEIDKNLPGFVDALRKAILDVTLADMRSDLPTVHQRYARLLTDRFSADETTELLNFYRSPTGTKIIAAKFANIDIAKLVAQFNENPDAALSKSDIAKANEEAMPGIWKGMSAEDIGALLTFSLRPVARKLQGVAPAMAAIEADIANEPDPTLDAAIEAATQQVYKQFGLDEAVEE
jgi:uncharacterized protein DUF2059